MSYETIAIISIIVIILFVLGVVYRCATKTPKPSADTDSQTNSGLSFKTESTRKEIA